MAKIPGLPAQHIINQYKGTLDFYEYKGIPCVRSWPKQKKRDPYPLERANQDAFAYANQLWASIAPGVKEAYKEMAQGTPFTGKDLYIRAYVRGLG